MNFTKILPRTAYFAPVRYVCYYDTLTFTYNNGPTNNGVGATMTFNTYEVSFDYRVLELNDRVLVANQGPYNGIYDVIQVNPVVILRRSPDCDTIEDIASGNYVYVQSGYLFAGGVFCIYDDNNEYGFEFQDVGTRVIKVDHSGASAPYIYAQPAGINICADGNDPENDYKSVAFSIVDTLTNYRVLSIEMGDANRLLNLSRGSFNQHAGLTNIDAGAGATIVFTATGAVLGETLLATVRSSTNAVSLIRADITANDQITAVFSGAPGANTQLAFLSIA